MDTIKSSLHPSGIIEVKWCNVDKLFYVYMNDEPIHTQKSQPSGEDIDDAAHSDEWVRIIDSVKKGNRERCSMRMYYHFLEVLPPMEFNAKNFSFFCSEPVKTIHDVLYYYFLERDNDLYYIQVKPLTK